jgi:hypothetical protein
MNRSYFTVFTLFVGFALSLSSCEKSSCDDGIQNGNETGIDCGGDCDPCASCIDGIQNGNETGIDCGGDCVECFDCFSNYCTYLSGGTFNDPNSSITWKCTKKDGEPFVPEMTVLSDEMFNAYRYTFHNKGDVDLTTFKGDYSGRWSFDNPEDPTTFTLIFADGSHIDWTVILLSLTEGEFVTTAFDHEWTFEPGE